MQGLERHHALGRERLHALASQQLHVTHGPERGGDVLGEYPNIGTLTALHLQLEGLGLQGQHLQPFNPDSPRCTLNRYARPGELVEGLTRLLDGRVHRRHLHVLADKSAQHGFDRSAFEHRHRCGLGHLALDVSGRCAATQPDAKPVHLVPIEDFTGELGGFAETNGQHAGGERIEAADMTRLGSTQQAPYPKASRRRGQAEWLVEQQDTVDQSCPPVGPLP